MPNNPATPPNGTYTSADDIANGGLASWNGSFTYTNGAIAYTRTNPSQSYNTTNTSQGNAIVFSLTDNSVSPAQTVHFALPTYSAHGNGKAKYKGNVNNNSPKATDDTWTATQT